MIDENILKFIKENLRVELVTNQEYTDEPGWYGDVTIITATVKVYLKDELIFEDSSTESVTCS